MKIIEILDYIVPVTKRQFPEMFVFHLTMNTLYFDRLITELDESDLEFYIGNSSVAIIYYDPRINCSIGRSNSSKKKVLDVLFEKIIFDLSIDEKINVDFIINYLTGCKIENGILYD